MTPQPVKIYLSHIFSLDRNNPFVGRFAGGFMPMTGGYVGILKVVQDALKGTLKETK